jgi:hypothetical protein
LAGFDDKSLAIGGIYETTIHHLFDGNAGTWARRVKVLRANAHTERFELVGEEHGQRIDNGY